MSTLQTNIPFVEIAETGINVPETQDILQGVLQDYQDAFGGTLNIQSVATPQYVLASEQAQAIALMNGAMAFALSQFNPDTAIGRFQDALAKLYFISRKAGTATEVQAQCAGIPGMYLPAGVKAQDDDGNTYTSTAGAQFNNAGIANVTFLCDTVGVIPCPVGSLTHIVESVPGWDAVTNLTAGKTGTDVESRDSFELRRQEVVAKNATGSVQSLRGAVGDLSDVTDVYVVDNPTDETTTVGVTNYPLKPHSVYIAVVGGDDNEIAQTIWKRKDLGCDMNGNTTIKVYDTGAYSAPYPEYDITFNRPNSLPIKFKVNIKNSLTLPENIDLLIQNAIIAAFNGETSGFDRERLAGTIYASAYYSIVAGVSSKVDIESILIGTTTANQTIVTAGVDEMPIVQAEDIQVNLV